MTNFTPGTNALAVPLDGDKIKIVFMECISMYMCSDIKNVTSWHKYLSLKI